MWCVGGHGCLFVVLENRGSGLVCGDGRAESPYWANVIGGDTMGMYHCLQKGLTRQGKREGDFSSDLSASEVNSLAGACSDAL